MPTIDYLLIGHITADLVPNGRVLGGTVSYAAPIVQTFGHRVAILTSAAPNEPLLESLPASVALELVPATETTTFENIYQADGRVQYVHAVAAPLTYEAVPQAWRDVALVHLAPLVNEVDMSIAKHFPNATVLLTPQGYMRQWGNDGKVNFKRFLDSDVLNAVDILVLSKQDIAAAPDLETEFPKYTQHVIVTNGDKGGTYYHHGAATPYQAYPVSEIDPTGAGDVFAASLLASLPLLGNNLAKALQVAARLSALAVTVKGATLPFTASDIQKILHEVNHD